MNQTRLWTRAAALAAFALLFMPAISGQEASAVLHGYIRDATGAVVQAAIVTATHETTGFKRSAASNDQGYYEISFLPVGGYQVTVELSGFKRFTQTGVTLAVNQHARLDATLRVGSISESVDVKAEAPAVDTRSASVGHLVEERRILDLPLNGRSPLALAALLPGVGSVDIPGIAPEGARASVNGARLGSSNFLLDGSQFSEGFRNTSFVYPAPDALQEFRVITSNYSAEYGRNAGGVFNVITKSGTNEPHGSLWEFFRNDKLNARSAFARTKPVLKQNQFGFVLGGPIVRNRTFFFGEYQGTRIREEVLSSSAFPPTEAQRRGDFSGSPRIARDPSNRQPFPGNRIPPNLLDPVARRVLDQFVPLPNSPDGRWAGLESQPTDLNQYLIKLDDGTGKGRLSGRYFYNRGSVFHAFDVTNIPKYGANRNSQPRQSLSATHTYTFTPNLLNEFRFGYGRFPNIVSGILPVTLAGLGINATPPASPRPPQISVAGVMNLQPRAAGLDGKPLRVDHTWEWSNVASIVRARHTIKIGTQIQYLRTVRGLASFSNGQFTFNGSISGDALGDFLLGRPSRLVQTNEVTTDRKSVV